MNLLELNTFSFTYPGGEMPVVKDISLQVKRGELLLLCGPSGSGKTTLLRCLKPEISPHGATKGEILLEGIPLDKLPPQQSASQIGFVFQDPENQIVTDTVWHEMAFGLENLGVPSLEIRRRVAEMALFYGIDNWFDRKVSSLSGGEKQILNLAAVTVMRPQLLILDEPTAQLDPIAARNFLSHVSRLVDELGITVVLCEHRLDELLPACDRVALLEEGTLSFVGRPEDFVRHVYTSEVASVEASLPAPVRVFVHNEGLKGQIPLTIRQGRTWLEHNTRRMKVPPVLPEQAGDVLVQIQNLHYRYPDQQTPVLSDLDLALQKGEIHGILGGNGSGKTTLLKLVGGVLVPDEGHIRGDRQDGPVTVGLLSQNPKSMFYTDRLVDDFALCFEATADNLSAEQQATLNKLVERFGLDSLLTRHPYDLSGGELQRAALVKLLLYRPRLLLLDEPTKALDGGAKRELGALLQLLASEGHTVLLVTHDIEFVARTAHRISMLFGGKIVSTGTARGFFLENHFFTTQTARMAHGLVEQAVLDEDLMP